MIFLLLFANQIKQGMTPKTMLPRMLRVAPIRTTNNRIEVHDTAMTEAPLSSDPSFLAHQKINEHIAQARAREPRNPAPNSPICDLYSWNLDARIRPSSIDGKGYFVPIGRKDQEAAEGPQMDADLSFSPHRIEPVIPLRC